MAILKDLSRRFPHLEPVSLARIALMTARRHRVGVVHITSACPLCPRAAA